MNKTYYRYFAIVALAAMLSIPSMLRGHCDTMNGPVVKAAQKSLETGDVNYVLIWVKKEDESVVRKAFERTLSVRKIGAQAKDLVDMYFFETVVRIHRQGEGEPYTGLKAADTAVEAGIEAADKAVEKGSVDELLTTLTAKLKNEVQKKYEVLEHRKLYKLDDVEAGRQYVKVYVEFIHYVEQLFQAIEKMEEHNSHESRNIDGPPKVKEG